MARGRGKRKFYPEFYTDQELAQMETENGDNPNADTDADSEADNSKEDIVSDSLYDEASERGAEMARTKSSTGAKNEKIAETTDAVEAMEMIEDTEKTENTATVQKRTTAKSNGAATGKNGSTSRTSSSTAAKKSSGTKKSASKNIDKTDIPDNVKEKLYKTADSKTEVMLKKIDAMQRDYISQKLNVAKAETPYVNEAEADKDSDEKLIKNPEENFSEDTPEYNDYPFEDEPYKMMDIAAKVMCAADTEEPYNDSPYEEESVEDDATLDVDYQDDEYAEDEDEGMGDYEDEIPEIPQGNYTADPMREKYDVPDNILPFDVENAVKYAHRWALDRNPEYLDFDELGGDCTNYISQILLAGGCPMDKTPVLGWYYIDGNNKSPSWTGVEQLFKYIVKDKKFGIVAREIERDEVEAGDMVQLSFNGKTFQHTPFIVSVTRNPDNSVSYDKIKICAHSFDSENRPLDTYKWKNIRFIRVFGYIPEN